MQSDIIDFLTMFRDKIYRFFSSRKDAAMELVDALSSNTSAKSVVELSLNPLHRRNYCSITRVLDEFYETDKQVTEKNQQATQLLSSCCQPLTNLKRSHHLFAVDCTSAPRQFAETLYDRSFVHAPNPIIGNKPITIGHQYSIVAYLPEKDNDRRPPWVIPLSCERVATDQKGVMVGMQQISHCIASQKLFTDALCVIVGDCAYSSPVCLAFSSTNANQVHISRAKNNRTFYYPYHADNEPPKRNRGRPKKYGDKHALNDELTWRLPDETIEIEMFSKKGKSLVIKIEGWNNILMRGNKKAHVADCLFRLVRVRIYSRNDNELLFKRPLWLIAAGENRMMLTLTDIFTNYRQRFDLEHFFRFGKNRLLMDKSQTPDTTHEEAWWQLAMIAYTQLYLARNIAQNIPKPWERSLPVFKAPIQEKSPSQVQNDFYRICREIGTPARPLKPRKNSPGRQKGTLQPKRARHRIVLKNNKKIVGITNTT